MFYTELWLIIVAILISYGVTAVRMRRMYLELGSKADWTTARQLFLYPVVLILVWGPSSLATVVESLSPRPDVSWAEYLAAVVLPLMGFFDMIVFVFMSGMVTPSCCRVQEKRPESVTLNSDFRSSVVPAVC
eukprot:TRINITY_DN2994_c0_g1_i2.p2 TRINITY_DN2994_c0_g1~~TRINITY_DN2994_c0_g1_i2.p2  ORF type:complete len:132 (-),score=29.10 TRINITY_DN2994_c0_g1_i2:67-462(-)